MQRLQTLLLSNWVGNLSYTDKQEHDSSVLVLFFFAIKDLIITYLYFYCFQYEILHSNSSAKLLGNTTNKNGKDGDDAYITSFNSKFGITLYALSQSVLATNATSQ